eukprot:CAMPEP_0119048936 /NCGR_PEP_ID=MMETSP1177-20130426/61912_1 /TAXON_ID=2985 /ORGANISM="Ochromonas sp, Strain CCMP1899" /LENGTH=139 /DNA_ID=CAMNT_0007025511 /DNA_START=86 /DNA_END=501 /DNA_ORIENTATION=-
MSTIASSLGWFSRIVTITVELDGPIVTDDGEEFIIPWDTFSGKVSLFDLNENVKGRVKIVVMDGTKVWHSGFTLNIEQYLHYLDPFVSSDLCAREMRVTVDTGGNNCWLEGTTYLNFSIPLGKQYSGADCHASYSLSDL